MVPASVPRATNTTVPQFQLSAGGHLAFQGLNAECLPIDCRYHQRHRTRLRRVQAQACVLRALLFAAPYHWLFHLAPRSSLPAEGRKRQRHGSRSLGRGRMSDLDCLWLQSPHHPPAAASDQPAIRPCVSPISSCSTRSEVRAFSAPLQAFAKALDDLFGSLSPWSECLEKRLAFSERNCCSALSPFRNRASVTARMPSA